MNEVHIFNQDGDYMYFIQEADKPLRIFKLLNIIKLQENRIILPVARDELLDNIKSEKLANKTCKILDKSLSSK